MFFRYDTDPARMLRLFKLFRNQALRLRRYRETYGLWLLAALPAYAGTTVLLSVAIGPEPGDRLSGVFWFFLATGLVWLALAWGLGALFRRYPRKRRSPGERVAVCIGLAFVGFPAVSGLFGFWDEVRDDLVALLLAPGSRGALFGSWIWAGAGVFLASRGIVWLRLKDVYVEDFELDFLYRMLRPLLRDLPPNASCSLVCNPFSPAWTMETREDRRGSFIFRTYDDTLLEFKAVLAEGAVFTLRTLHRRIDKFKNKPKKIKNKGSKHRIVQAYRIEHPALRRTSADVADSYRALAAGWEKEVQGFVTDLRREPGEGRLVVVQKKKFAAPRDLAGSDLPSADLVLKTLRSLSVFVASLARLPDQRPA